jgi:hypothetical protein
MTSYRAHKIEKKDMHLTQKFLCEVCKLETVTAVLILDNLQESVTRISSNMLMLSMTNHFAISQRPPSVTVQIKTDQTISLKITARVIRDETSNHFKVVFDVTTVEPTIRHMLANGARFSGRRIFPTLDHE